MRVLVFMVRAATALVEQTARYLAQVQVFLYGLLPALLSPDELHRLTRRYYDTSYRDIEHRYPESAHKWTLEPWEERVLSRSILERHTVLVLGAGVGRESIALAQRGCTVIGLDINRDGLMMARGRATRQGASPTFLQADFLAVPLHLRQVEAILLSGVMYSAIPGRRRRQNCLRQYCALLKPGGTIVLNFVVARWPETTMQRRVHTWAAWLRRLPWSNHESQPGDACTNGHFMHVFTDDVEFRHELEEAGLSLVELDWHEAYAVVRDAHPGGGSRQSEK